MRSSPSDAHPILREVTSQLLAVFAELADMKIEVKS